MKRSLIIMTLLAAVSGCTAAHSAPSKAQPCAYKRVHGHVVVVKSCKPSQGPSHGIG